MYSRLWVWSWKRRGESENKQLLETMDTIMYAGSKISPFEAWPASGYPITTRLGAMGSIEDSTLQRQPQTGSKAMTIGEGPRRGLGDEQVDETGTAGFCTVLRSS